MARRTDLDLIELLYYTPAVEQNSKDAAIGLLNTFLEQLTEAEKNFDPYVYKFVKGALEKITKYDVSADKAFFLIKTGRGNKRKAEQEKYEFSIFQAMETLLQEQRTRKNVSLASRTLLEERNKRLHSAIAKKLGACTAAAVSKIYYKYSMQSQ